MEKKGFSIWILTLVILLGCPAYSKDSQPDGDSPSRIIGGQDAAAGDWPWQARLEVGQSDCGGSLIANTWVMTAAHCFNNNDASAIEVPPTSQIRVILGRVDLSTNAGEDFTGAGIVRVIVHPDYHPVNGRAQGNDSDIALIELATASSQQPVQLIGSAETQLAVPGITAMMTGWGFTDVDDDGEPFGDTNILQEVALPMVDCSQTSYPAGTFTENMVCAGGQAGMDSCQGDSGGPLVVPDGQGGFKQVGISSFGGSPDRACDDPDFPGVYAAVGQFEAWIQQNTGLAATALYFAHVGDGGGLTSDVVLANPSASATANGTLELFDDAGAPFPVGFLGGGNGQNSIAGSTPLGQTNTVNFSIQPRGTLTLLTDGEGAMARAGSAVVSSDRILGGVIRFNLPGVGIAGVGTSESLPGFIVPVRRVAGGINTGVALQNTGGPAITIRLSLRDEDGVEVASRTIADFAGRGHLAQFIDELFASADTSDFQGSLVVEVVGAGRVAATALELGTQPGEFTTLPVIPLVE